MELSQLGMIDATKLADPELFNRYFAVSIEEYLKTTDPLPRELTQFLWDESPTEDFDFLWQAIKVPAEDYQSAIAPIPRAVGMIHLGHKLLDASGKTVLFPPSIIPYCGGLSRFGRFQMEPRSALIQNRRRRLTPLALLREALNEKGYEDCELMQGFAMCPHGNWMPHAWLTGPDGTVFETDGHSSHFFGVKVPRSSIPPLFWSGGGCA